MPKRLKKLSEEVLHENPWWTYKHDTYELPNGDTGDYYYGETPGVVMIIPVMSDGRFVLTLQHRYLVDKQSIEFPAGGIPKGMRPLEAAKQELLEETGWIASEMVKVGEFEPANGYVKDHTHVYFATVVEQQAQQPDVTEEIEVIYRRADEVERMVQGNDIWDGQSMAAWSLVRHLFHKQVPETESPGLKGLLESFLDFS